jgi:2-iminobutanoate/2-iminopropanoate deaminase
MKITTTHLAPQAIGPYSQAVEANGFIFCSGQIALQPNGEFLDGNVEEQTKQVLENLKNVLEVGSSGINKVVKTTIFLSDIADFAKVNEIYGEFFGEHKPARATVAVKELPKNAKVEIEAIATN